MLSQAFLFPNPLAGATIIPGFRRPSSGRGWINWRRLKYQTVIHSWPFVALFKWLPWSHLIYLTSLFHHSDSNPLLFFRLQRKLGRLSLCHMWIRVTRCYIWPRWLPLPVCSLILKERPWEAQEPLTTACQTTWTIGPLLVVWNNYKHVVYLLNNLEKILEDSHYKSARVRSCSVPGLLENKEERRTKWL